MSSIFQNGISINTLSPRPGVFIWYSRIPEIRRSIFTRDTAHNLAGPANEIFQKTNFTLPFLNDEELNTINNFKALKKQIEWISGRFLIKQMIQSFFLKNIFLDQITLSYLEEGAPFVTGHPDIPVSISHSNNYTVAACSENKNQTIGVDIEKVAEKPDIYFLKTAFTQDEILGLKDDAARIFKHWTIKEAYLKYIKKGFNESLHRVEVINNEIRHNKMKMDVDIYSKFIAGTYALSLVSD